MIQLTSRQQALLKFLAGMTGYISVKDIARQFGYSQRTIRYDLEAVEIWLRDQGGDLQKKPNAGVRLEAGEELRRQLGSTLEFGALEKVFSPEQRMKTIYHSLLFSDGSVKAEDLADYLGVSTPTVMRDIRGMDQWMGDKQLTVTSKKGEGYRLSGEEREVRRCLVHALEELLGGRRAITRRSLTNRAVRSLPREGRSPAALAAGLLAAVDLDALGDLLDYARESLYHTMPEDDYIRLFLYLAVVARRAPAGGILPPEPRDSREKPGREGQLADLLTGRLGARLQLKLGDGETANLTRWLVSCNVKFPPKTDDKLAEQLSSIVDEMLEVLHSFPSYDMPDFYRDKLKVNLLAHLRLTIKKYQLQIPSPNPLLVQMKVNYPEIFTVVYRMADIFRQRTGIPLDEDEIGFIAMHIAANVEECNRLRSKKALIVCNTGQGAAMVLQSRIRSNLPRLEIRGTLSALDAENMDALSDVDFVISTVELPRLEKPVFKVSPIISAAELDRISQYLGGCLTVPESQQMARGQQSRQVVLEQLAEKYVPYRERERFLGELESILPFAGGMALRPRGDVAEENLMFQCSMILAKVGEGIAGLEEEFGLRVTTGKLLGLVIHILMSIPRWRSGNSNREYASEQYKNDNIEIYDYLVRYLREVSEEYGVPIPDKEALAFMRYFV